jgi:hypothetical protein
MPRRWGLPGSLVLRSTILRRIVILESEKGDIQVNTSATFIRARKPNIQLFSCVFLSRTSFDREWTNASTTNQYVGYYSGFDSSNSTH